MGKIVTDKSVYNLPGGSLAEVHKPFGDETYIAYVEIDGNYPAAGKITRDHNREEYILVIDGEIKIEVNGELFILRKGEMILIEDGDRYKIVGTAKVVVFVKDGEGGASIEEDL